MDAFHKPWMKTFWNPYLSAWQSGIFRKRLVNSVTSDLKTDTMTTYIAILRGINVSGKNKIKMAELRDKLATLGLQNFKTYIQSGNLVFSHPASSPDVLASDIKEAIFKHFGYDVPVLALKAEKLREVLEGNPFINQRSEDEGKLHITFLAEEPASEKLALLSNYAYPPDEIIAGEQAVYVFCPNGYGRTKFNNDFFEKKLGVTATTRNWKTSKKLLEMAEAI